MSGNMTALFLTITMACLSAVMIALTRKYDGTISNNHDGVFIGGNDSTYAERYLRNSEGEAAKSKAERSV